MPVLDFFTSIDFLGVSAVYRLSMSLVILHVFALFCCSMRNQFGKDVNEKAWCLKIVGVVGMFVILLQISNDTFEFYSDFAKYVGGFFLLFQIIVIIDLFYLWGEKWRDIYDGEDYQNPENQTKETNNCWGVVMFITSIVLYLGVGYFIFKNFQWFASQGDCTGHRNYIIISAVIIIFCLGMTIAPIAENKSILTSAAVSLYICYYTWSGLTSSPDIKCNDFVASNKTLWLQIGVGTALYMIALLYVSYSN